MPKFFSTGPITQESWIRAAEKGRHEPYSSRGLELRTFYRLEHHWFLIKQKAVGLGGDERSEDLDVLTAMIAGVEYPSLEVILKRGGDLRQRLDRFFGGDCLKSSHGRVLVVNDLGRVFIFRSRNGVMTVTVEKSMETTPGLLFLPGWNDAYHALGLYTFGSKDRVKIDSAVIDGARQLLIGLYPTIYNLADIGRNPEIRKLLYSLRFRTLTLLTIEELRTLLTGYLGWEVSERITQQIAIEAAMILEGFTTISFNYRRATAIKRIKEAECHA